MFTKSVARPSATILAKSVDKLQLDLPIGGGYVALAQMSKMKTFTEIYRKPQNREVRK